MASKIKVNEIQENTLNNGVVISNILKVDEISEYTNNNGLIVNPILKLKNNATIQDGSVSSPSIAFESDSNTGIYRISEDTIGIATNGTKVTEIQSLGTLNGVLGTDDRNLIQRVTNISGAVTNGTTVIPLDDTIPQITEGVEFLTLNITPKSSASELHIRYQLILANSVANTLIACLFRTGTADSLSVAYTYQATINTSTTVSGFWRGISGSTSQLTFNVRGGGSAAGTTTNNGISGTTRRFGGVSNSYIVIEEYL